MTASEVKALIAGFAVVCVAAVGAIVWHHQNPDAPLLARLAGPTVGAPPAKLVAVPFKAPVPQTKPDSRPKLADVGLAPSAPLPEPASGKGEPPHFDVVRIEPSGEAVVAGKGDPNAKIELLASGKVIAEATADSSGHFVVLPPTLSPGSYDMTLRQTSGSRAANVSTQSVAVSIPAKTNGKVVVAMAEPGKPTRLVAGPPVAPLIAIPLPPAAQPKPGATIAPPPAVDPAAPSLAIRSVELENGNGFFATGAAAPGTRIQVYLNGTHIAEVTAGPNGQWSVTIQKGLTGGHYAVRADASGVGHRVTARVEVPFDVPVAMVAAPKPQEPARSPVKVAAAPPAFPGPLSAPNPREVPGVGPAPAARPPAAVPAMPSIAEAKSDAVAPPVASPMPRPDLPAEAQIAHGAAVPRTPANAVIEQVDTALVVAGDNLWNISRARLGYGKRFTEVYAVNAAQIRDPKLIYPGQVFVVPAK